METTRTYHAFNTKIRRMILPGIVAVLAIVGLAACGGQASTEPTAVPAPPTVVPAMPTVAATETPMEGMEGMDGMTDMPTVTPQPVTPEETPTEAVNDTAEETPTPTSTDTPAPPAPTSTTQESADSEVTTEVQATLREWAIDLSQSEVPAGTIIFTVTNQGMMRHNLTVLDSSGKEIGATIDFAGSDGAQPLELELQPGMYTIVCSLPGHAARGQQTQLVVK